MTEPILQLHDITAGYGGITALHGVSLRIMPGQIVSLIGANGAGKSTLLMTICGQVRAKTGRIAFDGQDITHLPTHRIMRAGIAQAPEGRRVFARMSVRENLLIGGWATPPVQRRRLEDDMLALFPRLGERLRQPAGTLSGGEQQMLAIARALMAQPRLLLLDEPSLGLAPLVSRQIFAVIGQLNSAGLSILLVEQKAHQALRLAHWGVVLVNGRVSLQDVGPDLLLRPEIQAAYLEGAA